MITSERLIKIFGTLDAEKGTLKNQFEDITTFITPHKPTVTSKQSPGNRNKDKIRFTSIGIQSNATLSATLHGTLTPSTSQWKKFKFRDDDINDDKEVSDWLEDCATRQQKALNASNFNTRIHEAWQDIGSFCTTALGAFENPKDENGEFTGLRFDKYPIREYNFVMLGDGVGAFYRQFELTAADAREKFSVLPGFNGLGETIEKSLQAVDKAEIYKKHKFLHAIFPRDHFDREKLGGKNMPIESRYIAVEDKHSISESGFEEFPIAVARWSVNDDDNGWGRGPGWTALPEIKTLNRIKELSLRGLSKDVAPPLIVPHKGLVGGLKLGPNAPNYYDPNRGKPEYLTSGVRWDVTQFREEDLKREIQSAFLVDKLELPERADMTATEVTVRFDLLQRLLGPTFHRLTGEFLSPLMMRVFNIMLRAGAFKEVPQTILQRQQTNSLGELDIEYIGPLARSQRQEEVQAIQATYESASLIAQARQDMSVFDNLDDDEAIKIIGDQKGLPSKVMRDPNEVEEAREARAEQLQQQAELDQLQQVQEVAGA